MELLTFARNFIDSIIGRNQEFDKLLAKKDIDGIISQMESRKELIDDARTDYDMYSHPIMLREDKVIVDKDGKRQRVEKVWKLPIPFPVFINEVALVFLYGRPVKWTNNSTGTENAFAAYQKVIKRTRFDSKIRQCKRLAGAETESAMLFHVYRNRDGEPDVQIRVLAQSKGDEIRVRRDIFDNIISIGWGYYVKEAGKTVYHFDIYTHEQIFHCKREGIGWSYIAEPNIIGKIPIILYQQDKEWAGAEPMMSRLEYIVSRNADTNDYFADPLAIVSADIVKNMPEKKEASKLLIVKGAEGVDKAAKYLTWDNAPQSKKDEIEWLEDKIHMMTFTPKISLDTLKSLSQLSAKALRTVMLLADIKASKHKETHDEMLDRTSSLIIAIIKNVLNVSLSKECDKLIVQHEFQEPFGDDVADAISNIVKLYDAGLMSQESSIEQNPLVKDVRIEKERLKNEAKEREEEREDLFKQSDEEQLGSAK